jgi:phosphatidylglycerophosphate synthase
VDFWIASTIVLETGRQHEMRTREALPGTRGGLFLTKTLDLLDRATELCLGFVFQPNVVKQYDDTFSGIVDPALRSILNDHKSKIPPWFTANHITYTRTILVLPWLLSVACGHTIFPCILVILVDFGDVLDGIVARFLMDFKLGQDDDEKDDVMETSSKDNDSTPSCPPSPSPSDDESFGTCSGGSHGKKESVVFLSITTSILTWSWSMFCLVSFLEVVSTGSPHSMTSWVILHRNRKYGVFIDSICDKVFIIPCWIALLSTIAKESGRLPWLQYLVLTGLIVVECAAGVLIFRDYYTAGISAPKLVDGSELTTRNTVKVRKLGSLSRTVWFALMFCPLAVLIHYTMSRRLT